MENIVGVAAAGAKDMIISKEIPSSLGGDLFVVPICQRYPPICDMRRAVGVWLCAFFSSASAIS